MVLFFIPQHRVAVLARANTPRVDHLTDEDAAVAYLARMGYVQDDLHRWLHKLVAAHNGQRHALYHVRRVLHTTVDSLLSALADAVNVVVLEPVDVRL